jgi:peptidyl-prolyl cis-trans isomerase A (cyclophilin A)
MRKLLVPATLVVAVVACKSESPPEPARRDPAQTAVVGSQTTTTSATAPSAPPEQGVGRRPHQVPISPDDPKHGVWTLADATAGLPGDGGGDLVAKIDTSNGALTCKLYEDKTPITVANFVGLARGTRPWKDPKSGQWVSRPAYDKTTFHRIIKGFMIQGGDAAGDGSGEPGYVIPDEMWGGKHDRAGLLCMANRGADTNGAQFFITDAAAAHLDKGYTIFGECKPEAVVHQIAGVQTGLADRPVTPVVIKTVKISRSTY